MNEIYSVWLAPFSANFHHEIVLVTAEEIFLSYQHTG